MQIVEKLLRRTVFAAATAAILLAFAEGLAQIVGQSLLARMYSPARLLEIGLTLLVFVVVLLLREIRNELRLRRPTAAGASGPPQAQAGQRQE